MPHPTVRPARRIVCRIVCLGEAMIELAIDRTEPSQAAIGTAGDTLNTAVYLQRGLIAAGNRAEVAYATCMGTDAFSDRLFHLLEREGVDTSLVGRLPDRLPGLYAISTDEHGERSFSYWRENSAARRLFQPGTRPTLDELDACDVLYLSAITLAILPEPVRERLFAWIADWRARDGHRFAFDSNFRPRLWPSLQAARQATSAAWRLCDIALPSLDDEQALYGDPDETAVMQRLRDHGVRVGALKRGAAGPRCFQDHDAGRRFDPAERVVDSTAAGDSFNGGYLAALLAGADPGAALEAGHRCAAHVVGHRGAIVPRAGGVPSAHSNGS